MEKRLQSFAVLGLFVFYILVLVLIANPKVDDEYRAYYVERSTVDWRPSKYSASLLQGVDFSRPGLPDFVRFTSGISSHESWGRWTDANLGGYARITYETPFVGKVCAAVELRPAAAQVGRVAFIRIGAKEERFVTELGAPKWYRFDFMLDQPAEVVEIEPTASAGGVKEDPRKIGVGLYRLVVFPGRCDDTPFPALEREYE